MLCITMSLNHFIFCYERKAKIHIGLTKENHKTFAMNEEEKKI